MRGINHLSASALVLLAIMTTTAHGETSASGFEQFPASSTYKGKPKMPDFDGRDRDYREYRTRLREGLAEQPRSNFAGSYNLVDITVTGGIQIAIVESATGRVKWFDVLPGAWPDHDYAFRKDSRLLLSQWANGEKCYIDFYEWNGTQLHQLGNSVEAPIDSEGSCKDKLANSAHGQPR
ncbi:hypothetical protein [Hyphomicrobium sp. MC1]|uniref:hypothetical protein n=1 Tax=Hyphomicrobium sp. (strain MC1) TaxID=717785 RepID=UPI000213E1C8|nr:hypothetical protein [Hyphomicrobium sp. MC1]CCB65863.1 exported protein of unknown function [Hyphomicrobium sp. MC1]